MRIAVVNAARHSGCTLKDVAGGFGTVFTIGSSWPAKLLEAAKKNIAALPNISLAYLDAILSAHGAEVRVLEVSVLDDLIEADLYLIASSVTDCNLERDIGLEVKRRGARVGYFGTFASVVPEFYEAAADFIVREEIEPLAPSLARGEIPEGVVNGGFVSDLASLPFPSWDQFPVGRYRYKIITRRGITLPVMGSRGCAYLCDYCPYKVNARYRTRSVESLVREIGYLRERYDVYGISFRDPLRIFDRDAAREFGDRLRSEGLDIRFSMECRTDRLDDELLELLHRAGLRSLEIGIESSLPETVDSHLRRPPSAGQQEHIIRQCHRLGIRVIANYMLGLPNDTRTGMLDTIRYAKKLNTFAIQFTVATPYPGTALHREVKDRIFETDWERFNGWTNVFRHDTMSPEEIHRLREWAYVTYHFRPGYIWRFLRATAECP